MIQVTKLTSQRTERTPKIGHLPIAALAELRGQGSMLGVRGANRISRRYDTRSGAAALKSLKQNKLSSRIK